MTGPGVTPQPAAYSSYRTTQHHSSDCKCKSPNSQQYYVLYAPTTLLETEEEHTMSRRKLEEIIGTSGLAACEDNVIDSDEGESVDEEFFDAVSCLEE